MAQGVIRRDKFVSGSLGQMRHTKEIGH
jgi:hypothetical protein